MKNSNINKLIYNYIKKDNNKMLEIVKISKLEKILKVSETRFLITKEIEYLFQIIKNLKLEIPEKLKKKIKSKLQIKNKRGELFIIFVEKNKNWKNDFYNYKKRKSKNNRGILESKQKLRSDIFKDNLFVKYSNVDFENTNLNFGGFGNLEFYQDFDLKKKNNNFGSFEKFQEDLGLDLKNDFDLVEDFENKFKMNFQRKSKNILENNPKYDNNKLHLEKDLKINSKNNSKQEIRTLEEKKESIISLKLKKTDKKTKNSKNVSPKKLQRRIYFLKSQKNIRIIHYNRKIEKKQKKKLIESEIKNLQNSQKKNFYEKCQKNKIIEIVPKIVNLHEKTKILIILKKEIKNSKNTKIKIFFADEQTEGILLNPYTIKTLCPKSKTEKILKIKILIKTQKLTKTKKSDQIPKIETTQKIIEGKNFYFEYKNLLTNKNTKNSKAHFFESSDEELAENLIDHFKDYKKRDFETKLSEILDSVSKDKIFDYNDIFSNFESFFENDIEGNLIEEKIQIIQSCIKGWIMRKKYKLMKQSAIKIQTHFREGSK